MGFFAKPHRRVPSPEVHTDELWMGDAQVVLVPCHDAETPNLDEVLAESDAVGEAKRPSPKLRVLSCKEHGAIVSVHVGVHAVPVTNSEVARVKGTQSPVSELKEPVSPTSPARSAGSVRQLGQVRTCPVSETFPQHLLLQVKVPTSNTRTVEVDTTIAEEETDEVLARTHEVEMMPVRIAHPEFAELHEPRDEVEQPQAANNSRALTPKP